MSKGGALIQWQEIRERFRLNKIYEGLRVKDDRPRYIFDGKSRDYYRRFHPNKKTKAIFPPLGSVRTKDGILIPGLKTLYRPIMGGSPGTYFMRADGTAANKAAATGPVSDASKCMSIATVNGETFAVADLLSVSDQGGIYRENLVFPSPGSSGNQIVLQNVSGENPVISGADLRTGWADQGSNIWDDALTTEPEKVFFDGNMGTKAISKVAITSANEWFWVGNVLSIYSTSDPDTAFTNPGIEATIRDRCIEIRESYITIDGIDCTKAQLANILIYHATGDLIDHIVKNSILNHSGGNGIKSNCASTILQNLTIHENGISTVHHGIYMPAFADDFLIENCATYSNAGVGVHCFECKSGIVHYNSAYGNGTAGIIFHTAAADGIGQIYYNLCYGNGTDGIIIQSLSAGCEAYVYNNVLYGNVSDGLQLWDNDAVSAEKIVIKNNILMSNTGLELNHVDGAGEYILDNNCYFNNSGNMISYDGDTYTQAQFATYQSEKGQDANSISADPLFVDAPNYDFTLQSTSPCINAGENVGLIQDYIGNPVPQGSAPDIGAYEHMEEEMSVVTDLQAIETSLRQQALDLIANADTIAQAILELKVLDDTLDSAADVIEVD